MLLLSRYLTAPQGPHNDEGTGKVRVSAVGLKLRHFPLPMEADANNEKPVSNEERPMLIYMAAVIVTTY